MAPVSDYSTTPADNTTISGLAVSDATVVSTIDDIVRQMMADIRSADDANMKLTGDQTATGTKSFATVVAGFGRITTASASRLDLQATSVADTHERTRLVRDTTAFRQQTASSDASSTVDDYIATVGASGVTSHQWNVEGTNAFKVQSTTGDTEAQVSGTSASVRLIETDGTAGYRQTLIGHFADAFQIQTRNSSGTLVSTDYVIAKDGSGATSHSLRTAGSERLLVNSSGCTALAFTPTSDARIKDDIRDLNEVERRAAAKIKARTYTLKETGQRQIGYVAQEIIEAMASEGLDAFHYGLVIDGPIYAVNYDAVNAFRMG